MRYRRANIAGGTYFFTVNLADRKKPLLVEHAELLREVMQEVKARHPFRVEALVLLLDHLHALWTLPEGDADFAVRWMLIKAGFSRALPQGERVSASRMGKRERGIWQRRYWEHQIRGEADFEKARRLYSFQPGKARVRDAPARLAVFEHPSLCTCWKTAGVVGWRRGLRWAVRRMKVGIVLGFTTFSPTRVPK